MLLRQRRRIEGAVSLKGNVFVSDLGRMRRGTFFCVRGSLIEIGAPRGPALAVTFSAPAQQDQILGDDFRAVLLLSALFVFPTRGLEPALNVYLGALLHVLANDLRESLPGNDI